MMQRQQMDAPQGGMGGPPMGGPQGMEPEVMPDSMMGGPPPPPVPPQGGATAPGTPRPAARDAENMGDLGLF